MKIYRKTHENIEKNYKNDIISNNKHFKLVFIKEKEICI